MTLRELCEHAGVTRRAVQGYEAHGLVKPISTNKYGHLLYAESSLERVKQIKLYQRFGYRLSEIEGLLNASNEELRYSLQLKLQIWEQKKDETDELIAKIKELIEEIPSNV